MANTAAHDAAHDHHHESPMDYEAHQQAYKLFIALLKWSAIAGAVTMVLLYFIVQP